MSEPSKWRARNAAVLEALYAPYFEAFITALIIINAVILGALTYQYNLHGPGGTWVQILTALDQAIVTIFVGEILLKIALGRTAFFKNGWNVFDMAIVFFSAFGAAYPLSILRSLRVIRTLRLLRRVPSIQTVVESFMLAIPGIVSVLSSLLAVVFVFAVIGTRAYGDISPELFGTLHDAAFTLFTVLTLEGWDATARAIMAENAWAWLYFISFIAINSFVVLNLLIAVIINAMQKNYDIHADEERDEILEEVRALRADMAALVKRLEARE